MKNRSYHLWFALGFLAVSVLNYQYTAYAGETPVMIGSRLELFVDNYLIENMTGGAALTLHHPVPKEIAVIHDQPWEGSGCNYHTIFQDGDLFRMYYNCYHLNVSEGKLEDAHDLFGAYALSIDGIHWKKPRLGLFEYEGSKNNNIVWSGAGAHDFTPFKDTNPKCTPDARYKAVAWGIKPNGLLAFKSPDAIHWSRISEEPVITDGAFDTQNLAFWDEVRGEYRVYIRDFQDGRRCIRTAVSDDFINWTKPAWLQYPGAPDEQLYTNQVQPYYRAPHIFIGFPARYIEREWTAQMKNLPSYEHRKQRATAQERYGSAITDALFMSSRDGVTFKRWGEAFLRPGLRYKDNWAYGDNYIAWQVIETQSEISGAPNELSLFATESYWTGNNDNLRRYTLRIDGFVSVQAPLKGGGFLTKPLIFNGRELVINFSTSAAGGIRVQIQDESGNPLEGYSSDACLEIFGDELERVVEWKNGNDVSGLSGKPIRLKFTMKDADMYSFKFKE